MSGYRVRVERITTPFGPGPTSTTIGEGVLDSDPAVHVAFAGDVRMMSRIGKAMERGESPIALIEGWQVLDWHRTAD